MDHVLLLKFTQHNDLRRELLKTGKADLIEVTKPELSDIAVS